MVAHSAGETFDGVVDAQGRPAAEADRAGGAQFRLERAWPPIGPGSWPLALRTLREPRRYPASAVVAGWSPRGFVSTEPLKDIIRRVVPDGWSEHPAHWVVACDYATGRRVAFGRPDAPRAELADAVAASCAIPAFYYPVEIAGRTLRRRRHVLDLEPRPRPRRGPRPRRSASTRPPRCTRPVPGTRSSASPASFATPPGAGSAARPRSCAPAAPRSS